VGFKLEVNVINKIIVIHNGRTLTDLLDTESTDYASSHLTYGWVAMAIGMNPTVLRPTAHLARLFCCLFANLADHFAVKIYIFFGNYI
jgi:hypothetical protein